MAANLNPEELNALMDAIQEGRVQAPENPIRGTVLPYDLTSRDRIIRGQMPTLDAINEQIASVIGTAWSGRIRRAVRVTSLPASLLKFADFNAVMAPPATLCVLKLGSHAGAALAVLEPGLGDALLAAALGERKSHTEDVPPETRRELTSLERMVLRRLLTALTDAMATAWAPVLALQPEVLRFESDPRLATLAPPNEACVLSTFEISEGLTGRIQLAMPFSVIEPVKKLLMSPPRVGNGEDLRFGPKLAAELDRVPVEICAMLGSAKVTLGSLLELEVGHTLMLDSDESSPLRIRVQDREKLSGSPRVHNGSLAVVVKQSLAQEEEASFPHADRQPPSTPARAA